MIPWFLTVINGQPWSASMVNHGQCPWLTVVHDHGRPWIKTMVDRGA